MDPLWNSDRPGIWRLLIKMKEVVSADAGGTLLEREDVEIAEFISGIENSGAVEAGSALEIAEGELLVEAVPTEGFSDQNREKLPGGTGQVRDQIKEIIRGAGELEVQGYFFQNYLPRTEGKLSHSQNLNFRLILRTLFCLGETS